MPLLLQGQLLLESSTGLPSASHTYLPCFFHFRALHTSLLWSIHTHTHTHTHTIASSFSFFRLQLKYHPLKRLSLRPTCKIIYFTCFFLLPIISITIMYNHTTYTFLCVLHIKITHITTWTILPTHPPPWKTCLPWSWSLVPERLKTLGLLQLALSVSPFSSITFGSMHFETVIRYIHTMSCLFSKLAHDYYVMSIFLITKPLSDINVVSSAWLRKWKC